MKQLTEYTYDELAADAGTQQRAVVETTRRLLIAVDRLNRSTTVLTIVMIVLMVVQIGIAILTPILAR